MAAFDRLVAQEFGTLRAAGNTWPVSITVVGTTMYVLDRGDRKIYAYNTTSKAYDRSQDFDTLDAAGNRNPAGIWSDGQTMYVSDSEEDKAFAYNLQSKARDPAKDITFTPVGDVAPAAGALWGNSRTLFVIYTNINRVVAFDRLTLARVELQDVSGAAIPTIEDDLFGIWGTDTVVWIGDADDSVLYAFDLRDQRRLTSLDFTVLRSHLVERDLSGVVVRSVTRQDVDPAGLAWNSRSLLLLSNTAGRRGGDVFAFSPSGTANPTDGIQNTVLAAVSGGNAVLSDIAVEYAGPHPARSHEFTTTVLACDRANRTVLRFESGQYTAVAVGQSAVDAAFPGQPLLVGVASDGESVYLADQRSHTIEAFTAGVGDSRKSIAAAVVNSANPEIEFEGMTWDGESLLVLDGNANAVWGFTDGLRDPSKDVSRESLVSANPSIQPRGIATDDRYIYVADAAADGIHVFKSATVQRSRDTDQDVAATVVGGTGSIYAAAVDENDLYLSIGTSVRAVSYGLPVMIDPADDYTLTTEDLDGAESGLQPAGVAYDGTDYAVVDRRSGNTYSFKYSSATKSYSLVEAKNIPLDVVDPIIERALRINPADPPRRFQPAGITWDGEAYLLLDNSPQSSTRLSDQRIIRMVSDGAGGWTGRVVELKARRTSSFTRNPSHPAITDGQRLQVTTAYGFQYNPLEPNTSDPDADPPQITRAAADNWVIFHLSRAVQYNRDGTPLTPAELAARRAQWGTWTFSSQGLGSPIELAQGVCSDEVYTYVLGRTRAQQWIVSALLITESSSGLVPARSTVLADIPGGADLRGIAFDKRGHFYVSDFTNSVAYAYDYNWRRSPADDLTREHLAESSGIMWINDIGADDDGRLFVSDAYNRAIWSFTRTPATKTERDATKDVAASVIGNGTTNITGAAHDGTNLYLGYGSGATARLVAVSGGSRASSKDVANSVLTAAGVTSIDGLAWTGDTLLVLSANAVYGFKDGAADTTYNIPAASVTALLGTAAARGIAWLEGSIFIAGLTGDDLVLHRR